MALGKCRLQNTRKWVRKERFGLPEYLLRTCPSSLREGRRLKTKFRLGCHDLRSSSCRMQRVRNAQCPCCESRESETIQHALFECKAFEDGGHTVVHITALGAFRPAPPGFSFRGDTPAMAWSPSHVQHEGLTEGTTPHIVGAPGLDRHNRGRLRENNNNNKSSRGQRTQTYASLRLEVFDPAHPGCAP